MVPGSPVGRPRVGKVRKDESETAVRAYVASRLAARPDQAFLTEDLRVALNTTAVRRAGGARHWRPPGYKPPGRVAPSHAAPHQPASPKAFRDWLAVDGVTLNLGVGLVTIAVASGRSQRDVYRRLCLLAGVVHVFAAGDGTDRRVFAVVLTDGESDRRRLRAELDELADDWRWDDVDQETVEPALGTWIHLVRQAADREALRR